MRVRICAIGFVLLLSTIVFGQQEPKALLLDEHGLLACDDLRSRIDVLFAELSREPSAKGSVVIAGKPEAKHRSVFRERMVLAHAKWRRFDPERFTIVRVGSDNELKVQFWIVPAGAVYPPIEDPDPTYKLPSIIKSFMLDAEYPDEPGICPATDEPSPIGFFLRDNPKARANIVVRDTTLRRATAKGRRLIRQIAKASGVAPTRFRLFPRIRKRSDYYTPIVEYWYLP